MRNKINNNLKKDGSTNIKHNSTDTYNYINNRIKTFGIIKRVPEEMLKEMVKYSIDNANTLNNETLKSINTLFRKMDKNMKSKFISIYANELNIDISEEINFVLKFIYDRFDHSELRYSVSSYLEAQAEGSSESYRDYLAEYITEKVLDHIDSMLEDNNYALGDLLTDEEINYYSWFRKYLEYEYGSEYLLGYIYDMEIETEEDIETAYDGVITFEDFVKIAIEYGKKELY